jgi:hypothetical protein
MIPGSGAPRGGLTSGSGLRALPAIAFAPGVGAIDQRISVTAVIA